MKKELQNKLYEKYPKIFRQKDLSMQVTCMCWGIDTGDGWFDLIDKLCNTIQKECDKSANQIEAVQVKQKFGGLRFYIEPGSDIMYDLIRKAEGESYKTCENCGSTKNVSQNQKGWILTLCKQCRNENK